MAFPLVSKFLKRLPSHRRARQSRRPRGQSGRPLVLERLEDRLAPAVILWDGGPATMGTNWNDPLNWTGDVLPGAADDAQIGSVFAGITVTSSSNVTIRSVTSAAALHINAALTIATGGLANNESGTVTVHPAGTVAISGNLAGQTSNADRFAPLGTVRLTGPANATIPRLLEVMGQDRGNVAAGFTNNFALGTLALSNLTYVRLVDDAHNGSGTGAEALYVNTLIVPAWTPARQAHRRRSPRRSTSPCRSTAPSSAAPLSRPPITALSP